MADLNYLWKLQKLKLKQQMWTTRPYQLHLARDCEKKLDCLPLSQAKQKRS